MLPSTPRSRQQACRAGSRYHIEELHLERKEPGLDCGAVLEDLNDAARAIVWERHDVATVPRTLRR
jgi:hypothetical protein